MTPLDDVPRFDLFARMGGELLVLGASLAGSRSGRFLRRAVDADGRPLFVSAGAGGDRVEFTAVGLVDLIRGAMAATPHRTCPKCSGVGCKLCDGAGFLPRDPSALGRLLAAPTLPVGGDVTDVWGWVRQAKKGG